MAQFGASLLAPQRCCAPGRIRTRNPQIRSLVLCPLSYGRPALQNYPLCSAAGARGATSRTSSRSSRTAPGTLRSLRTYLRQV
jgi:hypothetical protein